MNKGKEQLEREQEVARKRKIIIEEFYPALIAATSSVDEAKMLIQATVSFIMEEVMMTMKETKLNDISKKIVKKLTAENIRVIEIEKLIGVLEKENLFVAREIIEGMKNAIDSTINDEMRGRKLDSLKPDWDKMLN